MSVSFGSIKEIVPRNTQFDVTPYVSRYLKKQILNDWTLYQKQLYGNRLYTHYFHEYYAVQDSYEEDYIPLDDRDKTKIGLSWNLGLYDNRLGGKWNRIAELCRDSIKRNFTLEHSLRCHYPENQRDINMLALFHYEYERETISFQRKRAREIITSLNDTGILIWKKDISKGIPAGNASFEDRP